MSEHPDHDSSEKFRHGRVVKLGCLTFILSMAVCLIISGLFARKAVEHVPRDEIFNAMARDSELVGYFIAGAFFSFPFSVFVTALVAVRFLRAR